MSKVAMMGHSRGGEGVTRAAIDSDAESPWQIRGLLLLGPTNFNLISVPYVHTVAVLPYCDGDISDLQVCSLFSSGNLICLFMCLVE